jgi:uncharacterized protein (TIGR00255 family)
MLLSMTGFGKAAHNFRDKTITIEIRSLNSKMTDIRFKMPYNYRDRELDLRKILSDRAERGKMDVSVNVRSASGEEAFTFNRPLFKFYFNQLQELKQELGIAEGDIIQSIMRIPAITGTEDTSVDDEEWSEVKQIFEEALNDFTSFRMSEGGAMEHDLRFRISNIMLFLQQIEPYEKERIAKMRLRMRQNLEEFLGRENVDKNRYEQEVLFYLEKIDITEEKVRLEQHCRYFMEQLDSDSTTLKGRTLNFISQEVGREINTLGAKAYSADIQHLVVQMKDELEKVKELVANLV